MRHVRKVCVLGLVKLFVVTGFLPCQIAPPVTPARPIADTYFGEKISDPYRWLEDQQSPESVQWMHTQADRTRSLLDSMPGRPALLADMLRYQYAADYVTSDLHPVGALLFFRKRMRGANQPALFVRDASGAEHKLFDPESLTTPGHHISLDNYLPFRSGRFVLLVLSADGSEEATGHILDVASGLELPDRLPRLWQELPNTSDQDVYYVGLEELQAGAPRLDKYRRPRVIRHRLGTPNAQDEIVLGQGTSPEIPVIDFTTPEAAPTAGSAFAFASVIHDVDTYREIYVGPAEALTRHRGWQRVCSMADKCSDAALVGDALYVVTFNRSLNGEILRVDAAHPSLASAEAVMPASGTVLAGVYIGRDVLFAAKDALYVSAMDHGYGTNYRIPYGKGGRSTRVAAPAGLGMIHTYGDSSVEGTFVQLMSWTSPGDFYHFRPGLQQAEPMHLVPHSDVNPTDLTFEEVDVRSWDGTAVPLSIVYRKDLQRDGKTPTLMMGYGAYGSSMVPVYSLRNMAWLERGYILAVAHVRGGGELGEGWHRAGKEETKPNTWRDFISCAQFLTDHRYTDPAHLGVHGQSAGGILIGRSITERPELFAAAIDAVPLADALRFETSANGPANVPEFGSVKTQAGFRALQEMSSYQHVRPGVHYPAVLVTAGANDPRIDPWQGGKMTAALQTAQAGPKPILLRVNYTSGHGHGDTVAQQMSDWTDYYSFLLWNFGFAEFQPKLADTAAR